MLNTLRLLCQCDTTLICLCSFKYMHCVCVCVCACACVHAFVVNQIVIEEDKKLFKLLELLGIYHEKGSTLVFVDKQENADELMRQLMKHAYPCMALHGGIDQYDRDSTITDFKNGVFKVMVSHVFV